MKYADIDKIYRTTPLAKIPWNYEAPPAALMALIGKGLIHPCKAVDLGCGAGNYAIFLADLGFDMTGLDSSPTAMRIAKVQAKRQGVRCRFLVADLLGDLHEIREVFEFAFDWELLHHIFPEDRGAYIHNVSKLLHPGALYMSVSFSEKDPQFGGTGKYRSTGIGTNLYFSSEDEIRSLLTPYFTIRDLKTIRIPGKSGHHCAVYVLAERR
jgi:cyclopropane fatty-acyl-phospholipid synthase-like methyltransferase